MRWILLATVLLSGCAATSEVLYDSDEEIPFSEVLGTNITACGVIATPPDSIYLSEYIDYKALIDKIPDLIPEQEEPIPVPEPVPMPPPAPTPTPAPAGTNVVEEVLSDCHWDASLHQVYFPPRYNRGQVVSVARQTPKGQLNEPAMAIGIIQSDQGPRVMASFARDAAYPRKHDIVLIGDHKRRHGRWRVADWRKMENQLKVVGQ